MSKIKIPDICPYCGGDVVLTSNSEIYGKEYGKHPRCYLCRTCKASVGVHPNNEPLGILANAELKKLKIQAHALFDPYWKEKGWRRNTAYRKLANKLGIQQEECHIGYFDKSMLLKAIAVLNDGLYK